MKIYVNEKEYQALSNAADQIHELICGGAEGQAAEDLSEIEKCLESMIEKCKKSFRRGE